MEKTSSYATILKASVLLLVVGLLFAFKADDSYKLISSVTTKVKYMTTDQMRNVYIIDGINQIIRYDTTGTVKGKFSDDRYGALTAIDATSPFNILAFYEDFNTIIALDNQLTAKSLYRLPEIGISNASAMCLSYDNYIWVYDQDEGKLKKVDREYKIIYESIDLREVVGELPNPNFMIERDQIIFLNDPKLGVMTFDMYGNFINFLPLMNLDSFQVIGGKIVFFDGVALRIFNYKNFSNVDPNMVQSLPLPDAENIEMIKAEKGYLYLYKEGDLQFYNTK